MTEQQADELTPEARARAVPIIGTSGHLQRLAVATPHAEPWHLLVAKVQAFGVRTVSQEIVLRYKNVGRLAREQWRALWELYRQSAPSKPKSLGALARIATPRVDWFDCDADISMGMMRIATRLVNYLLRLQVVCSASAWEHARSARDGTGVGTDADADADADARRPMRPAAVEGLMATRHAGDEVLDIVLAPSSVRCICPLVNKKRPPMAGCVALQLKLCGAPHEFRCETHPACEHSRRFGEHRVCLARFGARLVCTHVADGMDGTDAVRQMSSLEVGKRTTVECEAFMRSVAATAIAIREELVPAHDALKALEAELTQLKASSRARRGKDTRCTPSDSLDRRAAAALATGHVGANTEGATFRLVGMKSTRHDRTPPSHLKRYAHVFPDAKRFRTR
jgi:hypothetical protein